MQTTKKIKKKIKQEKNYKNSRFFTPKPAQPNAMGQFGQEKIWIFHGKITTN